MKEAALQAAESRQRPEPRLRLLTLLQQSPPLRRRALIVLVVSIPLWVYATTWDILVMLFENAAARQGIGVIDIVERVLVRLPLLPLLIGAYLIAANIVRQDGRTRCFVLSQAAVALAFTVLTRPVLIFSYYAVQTLFGHPATLGKVLHDLMPWQYWAATTIQYTIVYILGLVLIIGINVFLRFRSEQLRAAQLHSKWLEAKLGALRGQFNPHFFFNALNMIVALIRSDPDRAEKLLTELGTLLRRSLADGEQEFTTVREEFQFIDRYLAIVRARYEDRLTVVTEVDRSALECTVPAFLLVPLIENAIKHGVAKVPREDVVEIRGRRSGDSLIFIVHNGARTDGAGASVAPDGVGLKNTFRRLVAIYGTQCRFKSAPDAAGGWTASVMIPVQPVPQPDSRLLGEAAAP